MIQIIGDQRVGAHILLLFLGSKGTSESNKSLDVSRYLTPSSWVVSAAIKLYIICYLLSRLEVLGCAEAGEGWATFVERFFYEMILWPTVVVSPDDRPSYPLYLDLLPQHLLLSTGNIVIL
jgi:hypothetical protein